LIHHRVMKIIVIGLIIGYIKFHLRVIRALRVVRVIKVIMIIGIIRDVGVIRVIMDY
jgi:hypothetical protein